MSDETSDVASVAWPIVVKLAYPIEWGKGEFVDSLSFKRGTMGDLGDVTSGVLPTIDKALMIASRLCGQPLAMLKKLDGEDGSAVLEIAYGFFARCHGAGKTR